MQLGRERLSRFFVDHLDRIYCAKTHMLRRFREIAKLAHFKDLFFAIRETADDIENQIARMEEIYRLMDAQHGESACGGMTAMLDEAMLAMYEEGDDNALRDMAILFYLQNIEGIEAASFHVLQIASHKLNMPEVEQLVRENFDEAKEDRALLVAIATKYMAS